MALEPRRRRKGLLFWGFWAGFLMLITGCFGLFLGLVCRPSWYLPPAIDYERLEEDKREVVHLWEEIGRSLNEGRSITIELEPERVNRWLAARELIWPDDAVQLPPWCSEPFIRVNGDHLSGAAQIEYEGQRAVVSGEGAIQVDGDVIRIHPKDISIGMVPTPLKWSETWVRDALARVDGVISVSASEIVVRNEFLWRNGKVPCRVEDINVAGGRVRVNVTPR